MEVLKDLLTAWQHEGNNNKVLVFTKSVKLLEMLEQRLKEACACTAPAKLCAKNSLCLSSHTVPKVRWLSETGRP